MSEPTTTAPVAIKPEPANRPVVADNIVPKKIRILGVPLDLGASRRGVDMGPSAVRVAGLEARLEELGHVVEDGGNIMVAIAEQRKSGDPHAKYLKEITATCTKHAETVMKTLEAGKFPLVLGGDHSVAAGTVAGVAEAVTTWCVTGARVCVKERRTAFRLAADDADGFLGPQAVDQPALFLSSLSESMGGSDGKPVHRRLAAVLAFLGLVANAQASKRRDT